MVQSPLGGDGGCSAVRGASTPHPGLLLQEAPFIGLVAHRPRLLKGFCPWPAHQSARTVCECVTVCACGSVHLLGTPQAPASSPSRLHAPLDRSGTHLPGVCCPLPTSHLPDPVPGPWRPGCCRKGFSGKVQCLKACTTHVTTRDADIHRQALETVTQTLRTPPCVCGSSPWRRLVTAGCGWPAFPLLSNGQVGSARRRP